MQVRDIRWETHSRTSLSCTRSRARRTIYLMSDDQLAKLAVAREKALAVRRAQKVEKVRAEAARLEAPSEEAQSSVEP